MRTVALTALLLAAVALAAQTSALKAQGTDELRFTLILSRHGVRPPLTPNAALDPRSSSPWPAWEVPLGYLTPHGGLALNRMGAYMRLDLAKKGLLPAKGCLKSSQVYLYADTDERNIMSTFTTLEGLAPGCDPLPVNTIALERGVRDPLFSPTSGTFPAPSSEAVEADRRASMGSDAANYLTLSGNPELSELAHILAPDHARPPAKPILDEARPLAAASSLVEDLLLEYTDGKPANEVGWGHVDDAVLHRLMPLNIKAFGLVTRTPLAARSEASNLVAHILDTLEQAAETGAAAVPGAIGPAGTRLVYVSGHDSNLCGVGGLLGLHWTTGGLTDDTPPDSQIVFELWQDRKSKQFSVHLLYRAQSFEQLRMALPITLAHPPAEFVLTPPGCTAAEPCSFAVFDHAAHALLDPAYVKADLLPTESAKPTP